ncbi:RNA polymerase sigma factor [Streptomyces rimosus]|uniref:sigma-70 family RNA polymerase sigma factor n=1 Tax=Streptomyces rimosus TaxID=1927 RepID=UPI0004BEDD60|nr:sigma-70 family RNA polymerase sigma factor [Streptomyces rimosus]
MTQINPEIIDTAKKAASRLARENSYCEADDIEQFILLKYWESRDRFAGYEPAALYSIFRNIGVEHCKAERLHYTYNTAEWIYTPREIRNVLKHAYYCEDGREVIPNRKDDLIRVANDPKSVALTIWDIDEAIGGLTDTHQAAIEGAYLHGRTPAHGSAEQKRLQRAIDRLTERLNSKVDMKGKERAQAQNKARGVSSHSAAGMAESAYDGRGEGFVNHAINNMTSP